jgi:very-short-patch-repair endonuclease
MTPPEVRLCNRLRRSPSSIRFRRQYAIGPYVADFYCPAAKLVIEVDGLAHDFAGPAERDERRTAYMRSLGVNVLRIPAADVFADVDAVADGLIAMCADWIGPSTTHPGSDPG